MEKIWKEIPCFPMYKISTDGDMYSVRRKRMMSKPKQNAFELSNGVIRKSFTLQTLLACTFLGLDKKKLICYIEEVPGKEFTTAQEMSLFLGRYKGYVGNCIREGRPVSYVNGDLVHIRIADNLKNEIYQAKLAERLSNKKIT